ncbi:hypothetical protein ACFYXH_05235 [Streptomyces sp. NPDC002730]|uniref:hypothetical protein n=1 Tax=Streptomyces sp. NPDC002730 TaxID=3364662 RepID=UPI0036CB28FF
MTERPVGRLEILLAAYEYELGHCFRCPRRQIQVTRVGEITSPEGETPLYACRTCVAELLLAHDRALDPPDRRYRQIPRFPRQVESP